jgi:hypothetical protein
MKNAFVDLAIALAPLLLTPHLVALQTTSVPIPKFALCGTFFGDVRNRKDTSNLLF